MKLTKRMLCLAAAAMQIVSIALLTSCDRSPVPQANLPSNEDEAVSSAGEPLSSDTGSVEYPNDEYIRFPVEQDVTLTWWYDYDDSYYTGDFTKLEEHPFMKELQKKSKVAVAFVRPTSSDEAAEELNARIATGDMCDLVTHDGYTPSYEGSSIDALVENEVYRPLNAYVDLQMPNFNTLRQQYPVIDRVIVTRQGNILWIPRLNHVDDYQNPTMTSGMVVRKDLLDEVRFLSEDGESHYPVTIRDWERMLEQFRLIGVENPLSLFMGYGRCTFPDDVFLSAWNVKIELYRDPETEQVCYGAVSNGFFEYLKLLNRWYANGWLGDLNLTKENKLAQNYVGAWYGSADEVANLAKESHDPNYELIGVPDPVLNVGDKIVMRDSCRPVGTASTDSVFVAYDCTNGALACRLLDEFFTQEAYDRTSYGIEGTDYTKDADGNVTFTDKIKNNPDGIRCGVYQNAFMESLRRDPDVLVKYVYEQNVLDAIAQWGKSSCEYSFADIETLVFTEEEQEALEQFDLYDAVALASRNIVKGDGVGLEQWDEYVAGVHDAGDVEYVAVMRFAWDRFLAD